MIIGHAPSGYIMASLLLKQFETRGVQFHHYINRGG